MRGHADRKEHPYLIQDWCDRAAPFAAKGPKDLDFRPAAAEPVFTLWGKRSGSPVYGGWASMIAQRSTELLLCKERATRTESMALPQRTLSGYGRLGQNTAGGKIFQTGTMQSGSTD